MNFKFKDRQWFNTKFYKIIRKHDTVTDRCVVLDLSNNETSILSGYYLLEANQEYRKEK